MPLSPGLKPPSKPGQSGDPSGLPGRPKGSREKFSRGFLMDLAEVWQEKGKATMLHCATTNPDVFFATCARLIGPEVKLSIEAFSRLGWIRRISRSSRRSKPRSPPLTSMSPEQILGHVRDAVEAYESRVVLALPKPKD